MTQRRCVFSRRLMRCAVDCCHVVRRCLLIGCSRPQPRVGQLPLQVLLRVTESPLYRAHSPAARPPYDAKPHAFKEKGGASARQRVRGSKQASKLILPGYEVKRTDSVRLRAGPTFSSVVSNDLYNVREGAGAAADGRRVLVTHKGKILHWSLSDKFLVDLPMEPSSLEGNQCMNVHLKQL